MITSSTSAVDIESLDANTDLPTVLTALDQVTERLQQTHETLGAEVRRLSDELEVKNRELARKNRLADLGQFATHVAHEVRNSLMPVTLYLSVLRRRIDERADLDLLDKVSAGLSAVDVTVNDMLHFASDREPDLRPVDLRRLVADVWGGLEPQLEAHAIATRLDIPPVLRVDADREMISRAVLNLTLNAIDAMASGGTLLATACQRGGQFELELADSGPGWSDEVVERACEPFVTTKSHGTGLGLAIVERVVHAHGGRVRLSNRAAGGAVVQICLPLVYVEEAGQ